MVATLAPRRPQAAPARAIPPVSTPIWPPGARAILALSARGCRWPIGEVHDEDFHFCDAPRLRGTYCASHFQASRVGVAR